MQCTIFFLSFKIFQTLAISLMIEHINNLLIKKATVELRNTEHLRYKPGLFK